MQRFNQSIDVFMVANLQAHAAADPVVPCGVKDREDVTWTRMSIYLFGLPVASIYTFGWKMYTTRDVNRNVVQTKCMLLHYMSFI